MKRMDEPGGEPPKTSRPGDDGNGDGERGQGRAGRGGRGGCAGRGGRRGPEERRQERIEKHDLVVSRPAPGGQVASKKGTNGTEVHLLSNYFPLVKRTDWCIFHYRVDFLPDAEILTREKKKLVKVHQNVLGAYICDGNSLYVSHRLAPDPLELLSTRETDQSPVVINIRLVSQLDPTDVMYLQFYNIIVRKCLDAMGLEEIGRNYFDRHQAILIAAHGLELWPGYKTSMRNHESGVLLGVEITHKVLRKDNCLQAMRQAEAGARGDPKRAMKDALIGCVVMTHYNRKTYPVDDIDWETNASSTFDFKGTQISFIEYFKQRYGVVVRDRYQPMLVSRPRRRDFHRGMVGPILLVPELCQMTGLTDDMRSNHVLMRALSTHLHVGPDERIKKIYDFMHRLKGARGIKEELDRWGLKFHDKLVELPGRTVEREKILFAMGKSEVVSNQADWNNAFRNHQQMLTNVHLENWVIIVPSRDAYSMDNLINDMQKVGRPIKYNINRPKEVIRIADIRVPTYLSAIDQAMANHGKAKLQMLFVVLPKQVTDIYAAVKKRCAVDYGIATQCFVARNAHNDKARMSICTKVVVQINAKLGGQPWTVAIPLKKLMLVGFDVYHCGRRRGASVGAMVATTNEHQSRYFSTVSFHNSREELSSNLCTDMTKCLFAFQQVNKDLPDRIIMYRDGVGDGQLTFVYDTELRQLQNAMQQIYTNAGRNLPKFTFIVVSKKINTRIFKVQRGPGPGRAENPEAGTVVDDVITLPERYDFYLISQHTRQGTVSPTSYNVLYDTQGLNPDKIQRLTYKMCHMYFNWTGTVTVPAPCQYAHKLAYLTGIALQGNSSNENLSHFLHFL